MDVETTTFILFGLAVVWSFIGFLMYMANGHYVNKPLKKMVFCLICGPVGWIWGIVDWCRN